jgi:hypothetical protein
MRAATVLAAALAFGFAAAPAAAQSATQPTDTIELTARAPSDGSTPSNQACGEFNYFAMGPDAAPSEAEKAYVTSSTSAASCAAIFEYTVPKAFNVTDGPSATVFVGCEQESVVNGIRIGYYYNKEFVASQDASPSPTCSPGDALQATAEFDQPDTTAYQPGDTIRLNVTVFGDPGQTDNFHVIAGGNDTKSTLTVPGLEDAFAPDEPEDDASLKNDTNTSEDEDLAGQTGDDANDDGSNGIPGFGAPAAIAAGVGLAAVKRARE